MWQILKTKASQRRTSLKIKGYIVIYCSEGSPHSVLFNWFALGSLQSDKVNSLVYLASSILRGRLNCISWLADPLLALLHLPDLDKLLGHVLFFSFLLNVLPIYGPTFTVEHQAGTEAVWASGPDKEGQKRSERPDGVSQEEKKEAAFTSKGAKSSLTQQSHVLNGLTCMCVRVSHIDSCNKH